MTPETIIIYWIYNESDDSLQSGPYASYGQAETARQQFTWKDDYKIIRTRMIVEGFVK